MWSFLSQFGPATAVLDFTDAFSPLLMGLIGVVWLSAGMIVWETIRHYQSRKRQSKEEAALTAADHRDAA